MATSFYFNNRQISLPGAYSTIVSGENNPARNLDYGKVLIIDTGVFGAKYGGGAGINGELANGQDAIYTFLNLADFRSFVKGGMFWKISEALFTPDPSNPAAIGISELYYVRACTTTPSEMKFTTGGGSTFAINTRDEGLWGNGTLEGDNLVSGYGYSIKAGSIDPNKWIFQIWKGTFTGLAEDGLPYGEETALQSSPQLMVESPEFNNVQTLIDWAKSDPNFNAYFAFNETDTVVGGDGDTKGVVIESDVSSLAGTYQISTGGTETYNATDIDSVLSQITDLDYNIVFTDQYGVNANSTITKKVITHLNFTAKFDHFLYVGGYGEATQFNDSITLAQGFDSDKIVLVHGNVGLNTEQSSVGYRWWTVMYNLAAIVGRVSGKPPYVPVTNKSIGIDRVKHILSDDDKKQALKYGVLVTIKNAFTRKFVVLQGINTLQDNTSLFNAKGQSFSIQFMRIVAQINRELVVNAEIDLLGQENGVNVNTLSAGDVKNWTTFYLQSRVATEDSDNLILAFQDVVVTQKEDAWFVTYKIRVNNEINKLFFTGFLIR